MYRLAEACQDWYGIVLFFLYEFFGSDASQGYVQLAIRSSAHNLSVLHNPIIAGTAGSVHFIKWGGASRPDSSFWIFLKSASRLLPNGWVELKSAGCRGHFRTFQLELDILDTKNFGNGPVVKKLQPLEVG